MNAFKKIILASLVIGTAVFVKIAYFPSNETPKTSQETTTPKTETKPEEILRPKEKTPESFVYVYFITQDKNDDESYKIAKQPYDKNAKTAETQLEAAIKALLKGPDYKEKKQGFYSEIPKGVKLLSIQETDNKVIINLNEAFEQGGGTDSLYKRLYQLIKTTSKNTKKEVFLDIEGKRADVFGGEGIMLTQPLTEKSLDE